MKNFIQNGDTITLTAPYSVESGGGVLVGSIFGIACNSALISSEVEVKLTGVFTMAKVATESWKVGDLVYWNDATKLVTTAAAGNALIGVAVAVSTNPSGKGNLRLNGAFATNTASAVTDTLISEDRTGIFNATSTKK
jgi:predicted RecA/RadA family phage recombinase